MSISPLLLSAFLSVGLFGLLHGPTMAKGKGTSKYITQRQRLQSEDLNYLKRVVSNPLTTEDKGMGAGK